MSKGPQNQRGYTNVRSGIYNYTEKLKGWGVCVCVGGGEGLEYGEKGGEW